MKMTAPSFCKVTEDVIQFGGPFNTLAGLLVAGLESFEIPADDQIIFTATAFRPYLINAGDNPRSQMRKHPGQLRPDVYYQEGSYWEWELRQGLVRSHMEARLVGKNKWHLKARFMISELPFKIPSHGEPEPSFIKSSAQAAWWQEHPREALWVIAEGAANHDFMKYVVDFLGQAEALSVSKFPEWLQLSRPLPHNLAEVTTLPDLWAAAAPILSKKVKLSDKTINNLSLKFRV